jgi:hypothetical protein
MLFSTRKKFLVTFTLIVFFVLTFIFGCFLVPTVKASNLILSNYGNIADGYGSHLYTYSGGSGGYGLLQQFTLASSSYISQISSNYIASQVITNGELGCCIVLSNSTVPFISIVENATNTNTFSLSSGQEVGLTFTFSGNIQYTAGIKYAFVVYVIGNNLNSTNYITQQCNLYSSDVGIGGNYYSWTSNQPNNNGWSYSADSVYAIFFIQGFDVSGGGINGGSLPWIVNFNVNPSIGGSGTWSPITGGIWGSDLQTSYTIGFTNFANNSEIKVVAKPLSGYVFTNFTITGDQSGIVYINPMNIWINASCTITINFAPIGSYLANLMANVDMYDNANGGGLIIFQYLNSSLADGFYGYGNYEMPIGTQLTLSYVAVSGWTFRDFFVTPDFSSFTYIQNSPYNYTIVNSVNIGVDFNSPISGGNTGSGTGTIIPILTSIFGNVTTDIIFVIFGVVCSLLTWKFAMTGLIAGIGISTFLCALAGILPIWAVGLCIVLDITLIVLGSGLLNRNGNGKVD